MGLLQLIKNFLYGLVTRSGIIFFIMPVLRPFMTKVIVWKATSESNYKIRDDSGKEMNGCIVDGKIYPPFGVAQLRSVKSAEIRPDDVLLCGYPKTGAHWMHEIMHMLVTGIAEPTKYGKEIGGMIDAVPGIIIDSLPSPRVINTHMLYEDLPTQVYEKKNKIVYTCRNAKDTVVSKYNHTLKIVDLYKYDGDFNDYFKLFLRGEAEYGVYFDHLLSWDKVMKTSGPNPILMVRFEDLKAAPVDTTKKVAAFLGLNITDQFAQDVMKACSFENMKKQRANDPMSKKLLRKGVVGDWKNWLTDDQSAQIDQVWKEKMLGCKFQPDY